MDSNSAIEYSSDINILLAYYNLKDKWQDEKIFGPAGMLVLRRGYKRVKKRYPDLVKNIEEQLNTLLNWSSKIVRVLMKLANLLPIY